MKALFLTGLRDIPTRDKLLTCAPDCIEAGGLVNLVALAMGLAERVRVLGEVQHMLDDAETVALAGSLADATVMAALLIYQVARGMREEEATHADD